MAGADIDIEAREKTIAALAAGANHSAAARMSGYSRKHIKVLVKSPEFMALVAERQRATARRVGPELVAVYEAAERVGLAALVDVAQSGENETARVNAAKALVELAGARAPRRDANPARAAAPAPDGPEPTAEELQRMIRVRA